MQFPEHVGMAVAQRRAVGALLIGACADQYEFGPGVVEQTRVLAFEPAITELLLELFREFRFLAIPEPEARRTARLRVLDRQGKACLWGDAEGALDVGWMARLLQHVGEMHLAVEQGDRIGAF